MSEAFTDVYRPVAFDQLVGQEPQRDALQVALKTGGSRAFLLSGPQGVGKTTLARIGARTLGAELIEIEAAVATGVDDMRGILEMVGSPSLSADTRAVILDEAHRISKNAWDAALKAIEEPPPHLYWFLATTEPDKVPKTIRDRCLHLKLRALRLDLLEELLWDVSKTEGLNIEPDVLQLCAIEANGSARAALNNLQACAPLQLAEASELLIGTSESPGVIQLCRLLVNGPGDWLQAMQIVTNMPEEPETARIIICNYLASCIRTAKSKNQTIRLLGYLEAFATPYHSGERLAPLLLSLGRCLLMGA